MRRFSAYFKYLRPVRGTFAWALFWGLLFGVSSGLSIPVMLQKVFGTLLSEQEVALTTWQLIGYASLLPAAFLVRGISGYLNTYLVNLCGVRVLEAIRRDYFAQLQRLPLSFFHRRQTGDLVSRGMADTNQLQVVLTTVANEAIKQPATLLAAIGTLVYLAWQNEDVVFLLLCFAIVPLAVFPIRLIGKNLLRRARQMQAQMGDVNGLFSENLGALKEVRAFGLEQREIDRFTARIRDLFHAQMKVVKYTILLSPIIEFIAATGIALSFVYAYRAELTADIFLALAGALYMSYQPVKKIGEINGALKRGQGSLERLEEILQEPLTIADPVSPVSVGRMQGHLAFEDVSFSYQPDEPVLRRISVSIPAGTTCALVGPSGAGKTTFANLVPRFYDVDQGRVSIDGVDVRSLRLADLRRQVAIVSQETILFNDTIYNNLLLGRPEATRDEVMAAACDAFAHDFIRQFPQGYDTIVGERGSQLSGGQRQRLALARAFLRAAPILILDEATSALDSESEAAIQQALKKLVVGKTVLIIAHRFSTIRDATLILFFEQGEIRASGTHRELHATHPRYRALYEQQHLPEPVP